MPKVFICYSRQNQDIVEVLSNDIKELGHDAWFDQELTGGQVWWDQILERISNCDVFAFALSPESLDHSTACKLELKYATDLHKTILPVLVADGVSTKLLPSAISKIQHVDYREQDKKTFSALNKAINNLPAPQPLPGSLPEPPEVPLSNLGKLKEEIATSDTLSIGKQKELLFDLEECRWEINDIEEINSLLIQFSKRDDLNAKIGKEIEVLLKRIKVSSQGQKASPEIEKLIEDVGAVLSIKRKVQRGTVAPNLNNEACILLKEASLDPNGQILHHRSLAGTSMQTNGKNLIASRERREVAKWEAALESLVDEDLLVEKGLKGQVFVLSNLGYQIADKIKL